MNIAAIVPVHADPHVANDTLDSIRRHMTDKVLVLADGWAYHDIQDKIEGQVLSGLCQGGAQGSHANRMFGLRNLYTAFPHCDWYCWIEYDALVANDTFKNDLEYVLPDEWVVGFCGGSNVFDIPVLPGIFRSPGLKELTYFLGAVVFHRREFLEQLYSDQMFEWIVNSTAMFSSCHTQGTLSQLPGIKLDNEMYDLGEFVAGTLAKRYDKNVRSLSHWDQQGWRKQVHGSDSRLYWSGNFEKYPIRWNPLLMEHENIFGVSSILHPLKAYDDPIRAAYREHRRA
jgi:hypothetical protein